MKEATIVFDLRSYWASGTGRGQGLAIDERCVRTPGGLPFLPGRTVKGLLRDGVTRAEAYGTPEVPEGTVARLFGSVPNNRRAGTTDDTDAQDTLERFHSNPGALAFGSATLGEQFEAWARANERALAPLFATLHSTAIDEDTGVVLEKTLRSLEAAVPMELRAPVWVRRDIPMTTPQGWEVALEAGAAHVRSLGRLRHRGFGRVQVSIEGGMS